MLVVIVEDLLATVENKGSDLIVFSWWAFGFAVHDLAWAALCESRGELRDCMVLEINRLLVFWFRYVVEDIVEVSKTNEQWLLEKIFVRCP